MRKQYDHDELHLDLVRDGAALDLLHVGKRVASGDDIPPVEAASKSPGET